jgi:hypothetical protein
VVKGEPVTEYYHRGAVAHLIGYPVALPLDLELQRPGEGETPACARMVERLCGDYSRFFDAVSGDSLYLEAPFINRCLKQGKDVIAVLKGEHRLLLQDAEGLFRTMPPGVWQEPDRIVKWWDADGFPAEGIPVPLRILHTQETIKRRERKAGKWVETIQTQTWSWGTTIPQSRLPTRALWEIGHAHWDVENDLFNDLVNHWNLDHCFTHHPTAIVNFILTLFIAFVLLQAFHQRNLKPQRRVRFTLIAIAQELHLGLTEAGFRAPWLLAAGARSP